MSKLKIQKVSPKDLRFRFDVQCEREIERAFEAYDEIFIHVGGYEFDRKLKIFSLDVIPENEQNFFWDWYHDLPVDKITAIEVGPADAWCEKPTFLVYYDEIPY